MKEQFGNITLIQGDCMDFLRECPDKVFPLAIADVPYGINVAKMSYTQEDGRICRQKNGAKLRVRKTRYEHKEWDSKVPTEEYFNELFRVSKHQIIWGVNYLPYSFFRGGRIVWDKLNGNNSFSDCEIAYSSLHFNVKAFRYMWSGMCQGKNMKEGHIQQGNKKLNEVRIHPTQKPVALYKWLLQNYAKPGDTILDTHLGSGSICIACHDMGFEMTGIELDPDYYAAARQRLINHQMQGKLF